MDFKAQITALIQNLMALDARKKMALGLAVLATLAAAILASAYINSPLTAPLYSNLSREDMNAMSRILSENAVEFVVLPENGSIEVTPSATARARMLLAEHGLPSSQESGYELFDRVNTLGLTSFMQDVTNKRAIEGELVRTIQMINGVNSARVHLVMPDRNVFRRNRDAPPSASVVLKTFGKLPQRSTQAIRHMVAAAVPGLDTGNVTIIGSDGTLLTSKDDGISGSTKLVELEKEYERDTENKIIAALGAHLGPENLRVSVTAKLNADKRRVDETVFDPESRVERSVQVVKEAGTTENTETSRPASIDQNLPDENELAGAGQSSSENSERREELTNYEINQRKISTVSDGYQVENLSIALVVNRIRLLELLGDNPKPEDIDAKVNELETIVKSAISVSDNRGDKVSVNLVEFLPLPEDALAPSDNAVASFFAIHFGAILNVVGLIVAVLLFAILGIRPVLAFLGRETPSNAEGGNLLANPGSPGTPSLMAGTAAGTLALGDGATQPGTDQTVSAPREAAEIAAAAAKEFAGGAPSNAGVGAAAPGIDLSNLAAQEHRVKSQLEEMIAQSEDRAAMVIKHWLQEDQAKPA